MRRGNKIELNTDIDIIKNRLSKAISDYYKTIDTISSHLPWEKVEFKVKKHQPKGDFFKFPFLLSNYSIQGAVKFTDSNIFQDDDSWHKVSGVAYSHPHSNSIRLVYKTTSKKKFVYLAHYIYVNGQRHIIPIGFVKLNQTVFYKFEKIKDKIYLTTINSSLPGSAGIAKSSINIPKYRIGIKLSTYHGGKLTPIKNYTIHLYEQVKRNIRRMA